jgi:hypothetical protein
MKTKEILIAVAVFLSAFAAIAQDSNRNESYYKPEGESFGKGSNVLNLGVGIGGFYSYWGAGYFETPNLVLSYENGTFGNVGPGTISLGALISYKSIGYNYSYPAYYYDQRWNYWIVGLRSAYHWNFTKSPKWDPYAGLMLGYYMVNYRLTSNDPFYREPGSPYYYLYNTSYGSYYAVSAYLGMRYYPTGKVGIWAELGYGYTNLALGVNFKF